MLMDKTRDSEYRYAKKLLEQGKIKALSILHLKQCFNLNDDELCAEANIYKLINKKIQNKMPAWHDIETVLLDMDGTLLDLHFENHF